MTKLIVALDVPFDRTHGLVAELQSRTGVRFFKLGVANLLDGNVHGLVRAILSSLFGAEDCELMLDLKLRDTPDTVRRVTCAAFGLGARFVTVCAEEAVVKAALEVAIEFPRCMVLPVGDLTSDSTTPNPVLGHISRCGGAVIPARDLELARRLNPHAAFVTPGVRLVGDGSEYDDHDPTTVVTPAVARALGADYVVVGRPITGAADPVAAARAYLKDLE